jgi:hypothetical protein
MADKALGSQDSVVVNFRLPVNKPSVTAQHMFVQNFGEFIQLSFFELVMPVVSAEASEEELAAVRDFGVHAECVSRVNIPHSRYPEFIKAMQKVIPAKKETKSKKP